MPVLKTAGHADVIDMSTVLAGRMFEQGQKVQIFGKVRDELFYSPR